MSSSRVAGSLHPAAGTHRGRASASRPPSRGGAPETARLTPRPVTSPTPASRWSTACASVAPTRPPTPRRLEHPPCRLSSIGIGEMSGRHILPTAERARVTLTSIRAYKCRFGGPPSLTWLWRGDVRAPVASRRIKAGTVRGYRPFRSFRARAHQLPPYLGASHRQTTTNQRRPRPSDA